MISAIAALCRESAKLGMGVAMSDARPAAVIRGKDHSPVWITVEVSGEFFEWRDGGIRHPTADPAGAAAPIRERLRSG
jgi:hypothetical protein